MPFRVLDQAPQYFSIDGTQLLSGGSLTFYESGTSVLKDTYTDPTLNAANDNPLTLDADGRSSDIWGDGNYRMVVANALGVVQWTRDFTQGPADIPSQAGNGGKFLGTDGESLSWHNVIQVPDPTGQSGKVLTNDGVDPTWAPATSQLPALVAGGILTNDGTTASWLDPSGTSGQFQVGGLLFQWGKGTISASGTTVANKPVTFPAAFNATPGYVGINGTGGSGVMSGGGLAILTATSQSTTGFTAWADTNMGFVPGEPPIVNDIPFNWFAIGTVTV